MNKKGLLCILSLSDYLINIIINASYKSKYNAFVVSKYVNHCQQEHNFLYFSFELKFLPLPQSKMLKLK